MLPWGLQKGPQSKFDALSPTLKSSTMSQDEKAKVFATVMINQCLVPMVGQGKQRSAELKTFATRVLSCCHAAQQDTQLTGEMSAMMFSVLKDVECACTSMLVLLDPLCAAPTSTLDEVMAAKDGYLVVLKQALGLSAHYQKLQAAIRSTDVASMTMIPRLLELAKKVVEQPAQHMDAVIDELPSFAAALREGATAPLEQALSHALKKVGESMDTKNVEEMERTNLLCAKACAVAIAEKPFFQTLQEKRSPQSKLIASNDFERQVTRDKVTKSQSLLASRVS